MAKKKAEKESGEAILLDIKREMAEPRMAKSAREMEVNPGATRIMRDKRGKTKL